MPSPRPSTAGRLELYLSAFLLRGAAHKAAYPAASEGAALIVFLYIIMYIYAFSDEKCRCRHRTAIRSLWQRRVRLTVERCTKCQSSAQRFIATRAGKLAKATVKVWFDPGYFWPLCGLRECTVLDRLSFGGAYRYCPNRACRWRCRAGYF